MSSNTAAILIFAGIVAFTVVGIAWEIASWNECLEKNFFWFCVRLLG